MTVEAPARRSRERLGGGGGGRGMRTAPIKSRMQPVSYRMHQFSPAREMVLLCLFNCWRGRKKKKKKERK